jgi:hypothetical protein
LGTKLVYHYTQWKNIEPDFVVGITGFTDKKIRSYFGLQFLQFYDAASKGTQSPISSKISWKVLITVQRDLGRLAG